MSGNIHTDEQLAIAKRTAASNSDEETGGGGGGPERGWGGCRVMMGGWEREARRMGISCMSIAIPPAEATTNAHSPG